MFCRAAREGRPAFPFVFENLHRQRTISLRRSIIQRRNTSVLIPAAWAISNLLLDFIGEVLRLFGKVLRLLRLWGY